MSRAFQQGAQIAAAMMRQQAASRAGFGLCAQADETCECPDVHSPASTFNALLHITLPDGDGSDPEVAEERHFAPIWLALQAMCAINEWHIRRSIKRAKRGLCAPIPPLMASGVRYKEDPPGEENWRDCYAVLANGTGDCDQLVAWRVAELRAMGISAEPVLKWQRIPKQMMISLGHPAGQIPDGGVDMVHCLVRFPDGRIEDTSKLLGMGGSFTNAI